MQRALNSSFTGPPPSPNGARPSFDASRAVARDVLVDAQTAAPELLGCVLVREHRGVRRAGLIVEAEAYPHDDPACHAFRGRTARNGALFERAGLAYVYRIHRCHCFNVVTGPVGRGEGVLVRALEPIEGLTAMERARRRATVGSLVPRGESLTNGPGKLCQALGIDLTFDKAELIDGAGSAARLYLLGRAVKPRIRVSTRIGISQAREKKLRFTIDGNAWVSR